MGTIQNEQKIKLLSMTDFVLQEEKKGMQNTDRHLRFERILRYVKFLKQPLKLEMFVPCDEDGNVLDSEPCSLGMFSEGNPFYDTYLKDLNVWQKAKEKVLFEGFTFKKETKDSYFLLEEGIYTHVLTKIRPITIENLVGMDKLTLTESAIKQFKNK